MSRVQDLVLAAYETMANVTVHAYAGEPGTLDLHARHGGSLITGRGRWRPAAARARASAIHTLADEASLHRRAGRHDRREELGLRPDL
jgi:hypothetical protein